MKKKKKINNNQTKQKNLTDFKQALLIWLIYSCFPRDHAPTNSVAPLLTKQRQTIHHSLLFPLTKG